MSAINIDVESKVVKISGRTLTPSTLYSNEDKSYEMSIALTEVKDTKLLDWLSGPEVLALWLIALPPKYDQISGALFVISKQSEQLIFRMNCPEGAWLGGKLSASSMFNAMQEYIHQEELDIEITQNGGTVHLYFRIGDAKPW